MIRKLIPPGFRHLLRGRVQWALAQPVRASSQKRVVGGPFRGMLLPDSRFGMTLRFLLGTYELELHGVIERLVTTGLHTVIECGGGQGYYAVGFALRCPEAQVIAFETVPNRQQDIAAAAQLNGVGDRVAVRGGCDAETLRNCLASAREPLLVFADMDGAELEVFRAETVACLSHATVLIETHDDLVPGTSNQLLTRFAATHRVHVYLPQHRTRHDLPREVTSGVWRAISQLVVWLVKEYRPSPQRWLLFTPLGAP